MNARGKLFDAQDLKPVVKGRFVEVALPTPVDRVFDYLVPEPLSERAKVGHRVTVPFGKRSLQGFVVAEKHDSTLMRHQIKEILEAPDDEPLLGQGMLQLTKWMAEYYACAWGEALQAVLPAVVRTGRKRRMLTVLRLAKSPAETLGHAAELEDKARASKSGGERTLGYARVLRAMGTFVEDVFTPAHLAEKLGVSESPIRTLVKQGWLRFEKIEPEHAPGGGMLGAPERVPETLTYDQHKALEAVGGAVDRDEFKTFLLFGVTGSGKTEVYIRAIARALEHGKSAIVLVPEISLTPQTVRRFASRFDGVSVLHSSMTDAERRDAWKAIGSGKSRVVIGPRSALFAPVKDLGLVVVDEEHEGTYKQDSTPRYHARDTAIMRCRLERAVALLGSATPSLETWHNAQAGKYELLELKSRVRPESRVPGPGSTAKDAGHGTRDAGHAVPDAGHGTRDSGLASVEIIDMAQECREQHAMTFFSRRLRGACSAALERDEQVIIFLNRRGYHTLLSCANCGQAMMCPQCDIPMSFHRGLKKMACHYCLNTAPIPRQCPHCLGGPVKLMGMGTERLEEELNVIFAGRQIARMDSDVMKTREDYEVTLDAFRAGETQILVGTQMIAKGLDFPDVTVVGVVSADVGMGLGDFRSYERSFQLLTQVAGRAGRGSKPGVVIVQTFQPEHVSIVTGARQDYRAFVSYELQHRNESNYPPFSRVVLVTVEAHDAAKADEEAGKVAATAEDFSKRYQGTIYQVAGPFEAPIAKLRGRHRRQVMIKARGFREVRGVVEAIKPLVKVGERLRMSIDVDPVNML
ncbi:MAG: primosomal protein N' [Planctomycetes bacterium]|nr:primosomal protein N' [Planctomycetota bacterium]